MKRFLLIGVAILLAAAGATAYSMDKEPASAAMGKSLPDIEHPMKNPKMYSKTMRCPNCGMMINMWARTRHSFHHPEGDLTTCSVRCLADKSVSSGSEADNVTVALYTDPDNMIPAEEALYVIGSSAPGTMTMKSKLAFADQASAREFSENYGGEVADFKTALAAAKMELPKSRMMIDKKRKETGKIKVPTADDFCTVCGMPAAEHPDHNAQIWTMSGETLHFCSTQCMVNFNADPAQFVKEPVKTKMAWVTLYSDNMYESAFGAYYVVGSQVMGPMGKEALPFKYKKNAQEFIKTNGGKIVSYSELSPPLVLE